MPVDHFDIKSAFIQERYSHDKPVYVKKTQNSTVPSCVSARKAAFSLKTFFVPYQKHNYTSKELKNGFLS